MYGKEIEQSQTDSMEYYFGFFTSMNMERSQMRMARSPQAVAKLMPFGLKLTLRAVSLCFSVKRHVPVDTSHTLTV